MAKTFTKIGKEISMAVKEGGPNPESNARLRAAIQNAKGANMPKTNIENAIKKASSKDTANMDEVTYEGYGPYGIAVFIETVTDNPTRTVANVRMIFRKFEGSLGTNGSLEFLFDRKANFTIKSEGVDLEELELSLIDYGLEELEGDEEEVLIVTEFADFGSMQKGLEELGHEIVSAEKVRNPLSTVKLEGEERETIEKMIDMFEDDDDIVNVFTNLE